MGHKRVETFGDCASHGLNILVTCTRCGRQVQFSGAALAAHFRARGRRPLISTAGRYFVCRGHGVIKGCGHRGAHLSLAHLDPEPQRALPPAPIGERVPLGVDRAAWARADERGRKRLIRQARG